MSRLRSHRRAQKRGFTFVDLMAGALIIPTIVLTLALSRAREQAREAACQASLSAVGKGVVMYSALSNDKFPFPMMYKQGDPNAPVSAKTVSDKVFDKQLGTSAMQNVWIMINENLCAPDMFHCPSDLSWTKRTVNAKFGWTSPTEFSYGMHFPYDEDQNGKKSDAKLSDNNAIPMLVMFADSNPGGPVGGKFSPTNHPFNGESILRRDSAVTFYKSTADSKCGFGGDDIYINSAGVAGGIPTDANDPKLKGGDTSICLRPASQPASAPAK